MSRRARLGRDGRPHGARRSLTPPELKTSVAQGKTFCVGREGAVDLQEALTAVSNLLRRNGHRPTLCDVLAYVDVRADQTLVWVTPRYTLEDLPLLELAATQAGLAVNP